MSEVSATVSNLLVLMRQCATGFGPVRAAFFAAGESTRGALDLAFGSPEEARVFGDDAVGVGGETIKAHINADRRFSFNRRLSSTLSILITGKTNKGLTDAAVCWSFQTSLENTTLKNSGVGSKRLIKPSLSHPENDEM